MRINMEGGVWAFILLTAMLAPSLYLMSNLIVYDFQRLLLTGLLSLLLLMAVYLREPAVLSGWSFYIVSLFVALGVLSSFFNGGGIHHWVEVSMVVLLILGVVGVAKGINHYPHALDSWVKPAWLLGALAYLCITLIYLYSLHVNNGGVTGYQPMHGFNNPRFLNQYQSWFVPVLTGLLFMKPPRFLSQSTWVVAVSFCAAMHWALVWQTQGRGVMLGLLVSSCFVALILGAKGRRFALVTLVLALLGAILAWLLFKSPALVSETSRFLSTGLSLRELLWGDALNYISTHPWLGIGPMHLATEMSAIAAHPHNAVLQMAAEWGMPATLLLCYLLFSSGARWLVWARGNMLGGQASVSPYWLVALTAAMVTAGVHSMFSGIIVMPVSQLMLVLVLGIALGLYRKNVPIIKESVHSKCSYAAILSGVMAVILLYLYIWDSRDIVFEERGKQEYKKTEMSIVNSKFRPRFWVDGLKLSD